VKIRLLNELLINLIPDNELYMVVANETIKMKYNIDAQAQLSKILLFNFILQPIFQFIDILIYLLL